MKVLSYMRIGSDLSSVEVELNLNPGLPNISFLGLPDTALRESALRIRSALREQGYQIPQAQQIIVHLRPSYLRKTSRGLDLAVAAALLWETGQIPQPSEGQTPVLYGELTLKGQVIRPDDLDEVEPPQETAVMTGPGEKPLPFATYEVRELRNLLSPDQRWVPGQEEKWQRPNASVKSFPKKAADLGAVIAAGEHATLFAGPPGSGKTTLAESIGAWIEEPDIEELRLARRLNRQVGRELHWRPLLRPHHSITPLAMIGGGTALWAGEISRAHGGVLIMDELLEFDPVIQEALREPVESGSISIVRAGSSKTYAAQILLLATTNLCLCGKFVPKRESLRTCRCSRNDRKKVMGRLRGPFADRFAIISLTDEWHESDEHVSVETVAHKVAQAVAFRQSRGQSVPNARTDVKEIEESLNEFQRETLIESLKLSRRRKAAVLRVARTLGDLDLCATLRNDHLDQAIGYAVRSHQLLDEWQD